jgi:hypothetical protein
VLSNTPLPPEADNVTVVVAVLEVPASLVTVNVKVVAAVMAGVVTPTPLVTLPTVLSIVPVPLLKTAVRVEVPPEVTAVGFAVKLVMAGAATTVTVAWEVMEVPAALVTVSV